MDRITPQSRPIYVLITALHELHLIKTFDMADKISNMQLADLNSKPYGRKSLRNLIDRAIVHLFYPLPGSVRYKILLLDQFRGPSHINCGQDNKNEVKMTKYPMHTIVLKNPAHIRSKKTARSSSFLFIQT